MQTARVTFFPSETLSLQRLMKCLLPFWALLLLWLAAPGAHGQTAGAPAGAARASATTAQQPAKPAAQTTRKPGGRGMHEGIAVHGWWVIEVKRPDGKLISHTEFENKLDAGGVGGVLATFFSQSNASNPDGSSNVVYTPGEWGITLGDPTSPPCSAQISGYPFNTSGGNSAPLFEYSGPFCVLTQLKPPAALYPLNCGSSAGVGCSYNLLPEDNNANLVLTGSVVSQSAGTISQVQTLLSICSGNVAPSACWKETTPDAAIDSAGGDFVGTFTAAPLPASSTATTPCGGSGQISCEVTVPEAGDTINVSVTISFQ